MYKKWILFLILVSLTIIAGSVYGQESQLLNTTAGSENPHTNNNVILHETTFTPVPKDSAFANVQVDWKKNPGQMPVYFFGLPPNSMPILNLSPVDEKMIIPIKSVEADSLKILNQDGE